MVPDEMVEFLHEIFFNEEGINHERKYRQHQ